MNTRPPTTAGDAVTDAIVGTNQRGTRVATLVASIVRPVAAHTDAAPVRAGSCWNVGHDGGQIVGAADVDPAPAGTAATRAVPTATAAANARAARLPRCSCLSISQPTVCDPTAPTGSTGNAAIPSPP